MTAHNEMCATVTLSEWQECNCKDSFGGNPMRPTSEPDPPQIDLVLLQIMKCSRCGRGKPREPDPVCLVCMNDDIHEAQQMRERHGEWLDEHV